MCLKKNIKKIDIQLVKTKYIGYSELDGVKGYCLYNMVSRKVSFSRNVIFDENVILLNMVHGSVITQLSTIQSLLAPPQNNPHIYLEYEVNTAQNNYVHPLSLESHIHPLNTQILPTIPQIHLNLSLKFNPILKIHIIPFPFPFFTI